VDLGGVEEGDAALNGGTNQTDQVLRVWRWPVALAHAHAAEPEGRDFQVADSKLSLLHFLSFQEPAVSAGWRGRSGR
jgi:hypothetical protein